MPSAYRAVFCERNNRKVDVLVYCTGGGEKCIYFVRKRVWNAHLSKKAWLLVQVLGFKAMVSRDYIRQFFPVIQFPSIARYTVGVWSLPLPPNSFLSTSFA
jgi:hypothetical protein